MDTWFRQMLSLAVTHVVQLMADIPQQRRTLSAQLCEVLARVRVSFDASDVVLDFAAFRRILHAVAEDMHVTTVRRAKTFLFETQGCTRLTNQRPFDRDDEWNELYGVG